MVEQLSRRRMVGAISAGTALVAVSRAGATLGPPRDTPFEGVRPRGASDGGTAADAVAGRAAAGLSLPAMSGPALARVSRVRSWDSCVYLVVADGACGFVALSPAAFSVAAACHAAGRPMAVRTWGHEAAWGEGAGRFAGAICAVDYADLPGAASTFSR